MKRIILLFTILHSSITSFAQVSYYNSSDEIETPSYIDYVKETERVVTYEIQAPDVKKLLEEDNNNIGKDISYRYGKAIDTALTLDDGIWTNVKDGRVWSICISSKGALSLDFVLSNIVLPIGGRLDIIGEDGITRAPVSYDKCPQSGTLNTIIVNGDKASFYLFEPTHSYGKSSLIVSKVVYGYKPVFDQIRENTCDVNVQCYPEYEEESRGVVYFYGINPGYSASGALVMNTFGDYKPYILTAFHNLDANGDGTLSASEKANCVNGTFEFNFKYDSCNGILLLWGDTYYGSTFKAAWNSTDFALIQLNNDSIKYNPNIRWLGWDRSTNTPTSGACIHHPNSNGMRISTIDNTFITSDYNNSGQYNHWKVNFTDGIIRRGSSGGPLLNQNKHIVGFIHGGHDSGNPCTWTEGWCGKLSDSWNGGGTNYTRLKDWLDPINSGATSVATSHPIPYYIEGATVPCGVPQYRVINLIPGDRVLWSWKSTTNVTIDQDSPNYNWCSFVAPASEFTNKLIATITNGSDTLQILEKLIDTGANFSGTYQQASATLTFGNDTYYVPGRSPRTFSNNSSFILYMGSQITLYSELFSNSTISCHSSQYAPYTKFGNYIYINLPYDGNTHGYYTTMYFTGSSNTDCARYHFSIDIYSPSQLPPIINGVNVEPANRSCKISISVNDSDGTIRNYQTKDGLPWTLCIAEQSTGKVKYNNTINSEFVSINTDNWESGVYIFRATLGEKSVTRKISLNTRTAYK